MSIFNWLGPVRATKQTMIGAPAEPTAEQKAWYGSGAPLAAFTVQTLQSFPGSSGFNYGSGNGGYAENSAVFACLQAIATAISEPELTVYDLAPGQRIELESTPLGDLLRRPNPYFSMDTLLAYLSTCLHVDGNAYWRKLRSGDPETGNVVELWPISPCSVTVVTDRETSDFITAYRYTLGAGGYEYIAPSNIVHFRYGLDDRDHRLGCSPLKRLCREVSSDDMATYYAERLLSKFAINGLTLTWDKDANAGKTLTQAEADELKARVSAAYGGDNAGSVAVLSPGATLTAIGFSPEQMDMRTLHRIPEERISAVLGVPAIVAGLGAGLDRSTFSNVREARELFTEQKLIPLWRSIAAEITLQLLPDFTSDASTVVEFDISDVRALADDQNAEAVRLKTLVEAGILTTDEARAEIGLEPMQQTSRPADQQISRAASRPQLRSLPIPERKAAEDLPGRYQTLRASELPDWEREILVFLEQQLRRVTRRLRAGADHASELVPEGEAILLGEVLTPLQLRLLGEVERLVMAEMGISFQLDDAATRAYLRDAGVNIGGITQTTRTAVQDALVEGQMAGEGIEQLARRLRDLPAFDAARARVVARTELGTSQNLSALTSYRASGVVVGIRVHDGDFDATCAAMDGRVFTLDQAPPALQHPNCTRALAPLTDAAELTRSA